MNRGSAGNRGRGQLPSNQHGQVYEDATSEDRIRTMYFTPTTSGIEASSTRNDTRDRRQSSSNSSKNIVPPLFLYIEAGDFRKATERAARHPREVQMWGSNKISKSNSSASGDDKQSESTQRLPLHHACMKLRSATASPVYKSNHSQTAEEDPFVEVCRFILFLIEMYPAACAERETRHGCFPLHLVAYVSCTERSDRSEGTNNHDSTAQSLSSPMNSMFSTSSMSSALPCPPSEGAASRPKPISRNISESTETSVYTTMTSAIAEEKNTGLQSEYQNEENLQHSNLSIQQSNSSSSGAVGHQYVQSVSMEKNLLVSVKREWWVVKVLNALLDAYPRAIKSGSEGGRLPLHYAATGRATPGMISTLIRAYPEAAKQRTKDGCLPIHFCAHWGISHSNVVVIMLKSYPDSTYGRNRWERTPLEEALSLAGENGRPYQGVLVRALRKHHSYWTRPDNVLFDPGRSRDAKHNIVDIDETLDSDSIDGDDSGENGRGGQRTNNGELIQNISPVANDLATWIRWQDWDLAAQRLKMMPGDARLNLKVDTRGGFASFSGFTPLHYACERHPPRDFLEALIKLNPGAVATKTMPGGKLPLHIACTWHAPKESIDLLLAVDRSLSKIPDNLGNLPIHAACFSGSPIDVVENLLKAYPKAVLCRTSQGSLPEDITKRLKHNNRDSALALINQCKDEVNTKRQMKHRRNRSAGHVSSTNQATVLNERYTSHTHSINYRIENSESGEIEVKYDGENENKKELVWI